MWFFSISLLFDIELFTKFQKHVFILFEFSLINFEQNVEFIIFTNNKRKRFDLNFISNRIVWKILGLNFELFTFKLGHNSKI